MAAMRIMHVILSRGFAGSERSTAESCNTQSREHEVALVLRRSHMSPSGASIREHVDPAVKVWTVPDLLFTRRELGRAIAHFRPDVIHTHLRRSTRLVTQLRPAAATIATLHLSVNGPQYLDLDGLICNAHWQKRDIPGEYPGAVFKMNNSLTPHRRLTPAEREQLRSDLGVGPSDYLVGGVGRLARSKGWDTLIRAFNAAALPSSRLVILGEGRERRRLERIAGPGVSLPGFRRNVKDYYQVFDLFVCPSRREPLPRVILEALDGGVPVVASTADGCLELVEQYGGDLFPIEDEHTLAALLERHCRAHTSRRVVDLAAHHVEVVNRTIVDAYREVIARRAQRLAGALTAASAIGPSEA
jgi:glycosyltransferase involved in cell wall biosynthesis